MTGESLVLIVQRYVRDQIITGEFKPNQKLKEEEIASSFNISRPPVREAFSILEAEGLVVKKPRRGVFVTEPQIVDVWEIYTLKAGLYELSMELAYGKIGSDELADLEKMIEAMNRHTTGGSFDIIGYQHTHVEFHKTIMQIAGNRRLTSYAETLHNQVCRFSYLALQYKEHVQEIMEYHNRIFQAVKGRDKPLACRLMKEHVLEGLRFQFQISGKMDSDQENLEKDETLEKVR
ncbi:MAG: GntR family transcriptional regulator [Desulfohalobiaceae bacterium]|nr:GntR family transcriptional regulator [Desulfohalobiaceae bacterium]